MRKSVFTLVAVMLMVSMAAASPFLFFEQRLYGYTSYVKSYDSEVSFGLNIDGVQYCVITGSGIYKYPCSNAWRSYRMTGDEANTVMNKVDSYLAEQNSFFRWIKYVDLYLTAKRFEV